MSHIREALRQPLSMRRPGIVLSIGALLSLIACSCGKPGKATADGSSGQDKALSVKIAPVESREERRTVESVGSLFAYDEVAVSAEVDGRAENVLVDVGDHVTKGEVLVQILPTEFELGVDQQQALLDQAKAKLGLTDIEQELGDPAQAASVKKAAADLANAEQKYRRTKNLVGQGVMSQQSFDQDEANYNAAKATYDLAVQDVRNLQAAIQQQRATTDLAKKKLRDTNIRAPFDGYIKDRFVTVGQFLKVTMTATPVMTIVNVDPMRVRLKVPERMAAWVPVGQPVTVSVEAYSDRTFNGKIWRIRALP